MPLNKVLLSSEEAAKKFAISIALTASTPSCYALHGDLGAGKTTFARYFLEALGWQGRVPSPTYTLAQPYYLPDKTVWHLDCYRLTTQEQALDLDLPQLLETSICLIEWPERVAAFLPAPHHALHFSVEDNQHWVAGL